MMTTQSKPAHTPTPWFTNGGTGEIVIHKRIPIGAMRFDGGNLPGEANAAHIVRCVNERNHLVRALTLLCDQLNHDFDMADDDRVSETLAQAYMLAKSVLANAEKEG